MPDLPPPKTLYNPWWGLRRSGWLAADAQSVVLELLSAVLVLRLVLLLSAVLVLLSAVLVVLSAVLVMLSAVLVMLSAVLVMLSAVLANGKSHQSGLAAVVLLAAVLPLGLLSLILMMLLVLLAVLPRPSRVVLPWDGGDRGGQRRAFFVPCVPLAPYGARIRNQGGSRINRGKARVTMGTFQVPSALAPTCGQDAQQGRGQHRQGDRRYRELTQGRYHGWMPWTAECQN